MAMDQQETDVNIPSTVTAVVAEFGDRNQAEAAVDALEEAGFDSNKVSFVARGAETVDGKFVPGVLLITVHAEGRDADAERILRSGGATKVTCGLVSATGEVLEESEMREEASSV
jgi:hypothetical protein